MSKGLLIAVSGFSGAGKSTLVRTLVDNYPGFALSVSATTRDPRPGEKEGVDYFFKTKEQFQWMIENGEFLEYEKYVSNFYGTPRKPVAEMMEQGKDVILEIDVRGALSVKRYNPDIILVFVSAPSVIELYHRLTNRGAEKEEIIAERMLQIERELDSISDYDYLLINDDLNDCITHLRYIVEAERQRIVNRNDRLNVLRREFDNYKSAGLMFNGGES